MRRTLAILGVILVGFIGLLYYCLTLFDWVQHTTPELLIGQQSENLPNVAALIIYSYVGYKFFRLKMHV